MLRRGRVRDGTQPHRVKILVVCPPSPEPASSAPCDSDRQGGPSADVTEEAAEAVAAEAEAAEAEAAVEAEEEAGRPARFSASPARPRAPHRRRAIAPLTLTLTLTLNLTLTLSPTPTPTLTQTRSATRAPARPCRCPPASQ